MLDNLLLFVIIRATFPHPLHSPGSLSGSARVCAIDMGPATQYMTWGEFVMNKIKENPELAGKVIGMPPTASALPDLSSTPANPMALAATGQHKSVGEQATKALRELFVSLPNNTTDVQLSEFLAHQCHELGICQYLAPLC